VSNVVVFGVNGVLGTVIAKELIGRGHTVAGVSRSGTSSLPGVVTSAGDATSSDDVARFATGADAAINAIGPHWDRQERLDLLTAAAAGLIEGLRKAHVPRLLIVGGAGSLKEADGVRHIDGGLPAQFRTAALIHAAARELYFTATDLDWTYISPPTMITPGSRTGTFRKGRDTLLVDADGNSAISNEDYAVGVVDELEKPTSIREQITFAY
jgi:uncharacterized protein